MKEEMNYPIKYAVLPIKVMPEECYAPGTFGGSEDFDVRGYIVSKVYLTKEIMSYEKDGTSKLYYEITYPYPTENSIYRERTYPYSIWSGEINRELVDNVFDTYEEAKEKANTLNEELKKQVYYCVSANGKEASKELESKIYYFEKKQVMYQSFEDKITELTEDMIVTKNRNLIRKPNIENV